MRASCDVLRGRLAVVLVRVHLELIVHEVHVKRWLEVRRLLADQEVPEGGSQWLRRS
jgi:hypothetical protein